MCVTGRLIPTSASLILASALLILVSILNIWLPVKDFYQTLNDEIYLTSQPYFDFVAQCFEIYGYYRIIGVLISPILLKGINYFPFKLITLCFLSIVNIILFGYVSLRCLRVKVTWLPWVISVPLLTPLWLRGTLCAPCLFNELLGGCIASGFLYLVIRFEFKLVYQGVLVFFYIFLALMTYESHLLQTLLILFVSRRFSLKSVVLPLLIAVFARWIFLIFDIIIHDPKISAVEENSRNWEMYYQYFSTKIGQLFRFIFSFFGALDRGDIWSKFLLTLALLGLFFSTQKDRKSDRTMPLILLLGSCSIPILQVFLMGSLGYGGITWIIVANSSLGFLISLVLLLGHRRFFPLLLFLFFFQISLSSSVQLEEVGEGVRNRETGKFDDSLLMRFYDGLKPANEAEDKQIRH